MEFSETLRNVREDRGLSRKQVADSIGVTVSSYASYETGRREPKYAILRKLSKVLNVSVDYLLGTDADEFTMYKRRVNAFENDSHIEDDADEKHLTLFIDIPAFDPPFYKGLRMTRKEFLDMCHKAIRQNPSNFENGLRTVFCNEYARAAWGSVCKILDYLPYNDEENFDA